MIIYNVTVQVAEAVAAGWLQWMQQEHIPQVMATSCFKNYRILQLMDIDETDGPTYAVQYEAAAEKDYYRYIAEHAPALRRQTEERWGDKVFAFRTVMRRVDDNK